MKNLNCLKKFVELDLKLSRHLSDRIIGFKHLDQAIKDL